MKVGVKFWNCTKVLVPQKRYVAQVFPELRLDFNLQQLVPKQDPTVPAHELSNLSASGISRPISLGPGHRKASSGMGPRLSWKARSLEEISTRRLPVPKGVWGDSGAEAEGVHMVQGVGYTLPLMSLLFRSLKTSSRVLPASGSFLNFSLSRMDNSHSGKGSISSSTVARISVLATKLRMRSLTTRCYSNTLCCTAGRRPTA